MLSLNYFEYQCVLLGVYQYGHNINSYWTSNAIQIDTEYSCAPEDGRNM
jgi:homospermidine synthase